MKPNDANKRAAVPMRAYDLAWIVFYVGAGFCLAAAVGLGIYLAYLCVMGALGG